MFAVRFFLSVILGVVLATASLAEWPVGGPATVTRPLSRADAVAQPVETAGEDGARLALSGSRPPLRPMMRAHYMPDTRWDFRGDSESWTRAAMSALRTHGSRLQDTVPRDIAVWCPAYAENPPRLRRAFWVGMISALVKYESTYRPAAVGGGNRWFGLLQIYPDTARRYGCRATTGDALKNPEDNLSCAIRIMSVTVPRDNAIALRDGRWRGVAAEWGPMTSPSKTAEMAAWTRRQEYCVPRRTIRPQARPVATVALPTLNND